MLLVLLAAEAKVPPIWPQIQGEFPRGAQRGTAVEVTLKGRNLQDAKSVAFVSGKLKGTVLSTSAYETKIRVDTAADAEPGRHDFRLLCAHGSALGYFDVGTLAERLEKEANDTRASAEALEMPALVNGILKAADYDHYRFRAAAGERFVFDLQATRLGANTDAVLSVFDGAGKELAYSDDYYGFKDPHLVFSAPAEGEYVLRVYGSGETGSDTSDYRLLAGKMPWADLAMPGGGRRGETVEFSVRGVNLSGLRGATLGDGLARAAVLWAKDTEARLKIAVPANAVAREYRLHLDGGALAVPFVVSDYAEVDVSDGSARSRRDPKPVSLPVVANGIFDRPKATDHFIFRVEKAMTVVLDVEGMQLGFLSDPMVLLYDETGKRLAYQDEPTTNTGKEPANMDPHLVFTLPKAGRYIAAIRDAQFRGDPAFLYRLTIREATPDFSVKVIGTDDTLYRGRVNKVLVRVRRLEGWNAPVEVKAVDLPRGVKVKPVVAEAKNTPYTGTCGETHYLDGTNVEMELEVDADAPLVLASLRLIGVGEFEGRRLERLSRARYFRSRIRHIGDAEEDALRVTVADAPGAVLDVPRSLTLDAKEMARFAVVVTRLDGSKAPMELSVEAESEGLSLQAAPVPASDTRADLRLLAAPRAPGTFRLVARVDGRVVGKSHPVDVRRKAQ